MEYTNSNFEANFDLIKSLINECDFISIDTELTGLSEESVNYYDTPELRYKFVKDYCMRFTVTQFGMCLFKYNHVAKYFEYFPLNFHLKPYSFESEKGNFLMNCETIEFLNKSKFDFNHSWKNGIQFIRLSEYKARTINLDLREQHSLEKISLNMEYFDFSHLTSLITRCTEFLDNDLQMELITEMPSDSFDKYLVLNELWKKVGCVNGNWILPTVVKLDGDKKQSIKFRKTGDVEAELRNSIAQSYVDRRKKLESRGKFAQVIKLISDSRKTIIAHNCFLDIMHTVDKFIEPLPQEYSDFKVMINNYFPKIIDTKYMSCDEKFKELQAHNLQTIYDRTKEDPFMNPDEMAQPFSQDYNFHEDNAFHTAHYDAMITGKVFISLAAYLGDNSNEFLSNIGTQMPAALNKYLNRIKVVHAEFGSLNFGARSVERCNSRQHVFHMTVPTVWDRHDIIRFFCETFKKPYKLFYEQIDMRWLNSTALMIKLPQNFDVKGASDVFEKLDGPVKIIPFHRFSGTSDNNSRCEMDADGFVCVKRRRSNFDT